MKYEVDHFCCRCVNSKDYTHEGIKLQDTHIFPFQMCSGFLMMNFFNLFALVSEQSVGDIKTYPPI